MKVDLNRTGLGAGAAERGGIREMFPAPQTTQMRRNHRADRPLIGRSIGVAADVAVNRADVQAGSATDAVKASRCSASASRCVRLLSRRTR